MSSILRIPKVQLSILLLLIFFSSFSHYSLLSNMDLLFVSVGFCILFDCLFFFLRKKKLLIPYAAIATGLIIALVVDPNVPWYQIMGMSAIAMGTKNFLRISDRHIFNPAAIGLFVGGIMFHRYISWWGASFQGNEGFTIQNIVVFLLLLSPILVSGFRLRRFYSILSFIFAYMLLSHIFTFTFSLLSIIGRMLDPTTIFFAVVMLPEPMTSPVNRKRQILFGVTVALVVQMLSYPALSNALSSRGLLPDIFLAALLFGNALFFRYR